MILHEAQAVPDVFAALRGVIDADREARGRFIVLGSAQASLVRRLSETLPGRVGILELDPLTALEASQGAPARSVTDVWVAGGDLGRRERLQHPHSQLWFWRTAAGAELDLVIERGSQRFGIEVKTGRATSPLLLRTLKGIAADIEASSITVIDQGSGVEPLAPGVERRGFGESIDWLPGP